MDPARPIFLTLAGFLAACAVACGQASYNEGDNDDPPTVNPCSELRPEDRPVNCQE